MGDLQWGGLDAGVAGNPDQSGMASFARTKYDNYSYKFPGGTRRDFESGEKYKVQRGFMRSLLGEIPSVSSVIPNSRFFFQFNPERIMRSVSVSSGLMNPLLQDPGQFSIATPGNATFSFDILLNREMEVNQASADTRSKTFDGTAVTASTDRFNSPGRIGVLSDLLVMDGIIGQGINSNTIDALAKLQSISSSWDTSDTSSGASAGDTTSNFISVDKAKEAFASIMGNSAFLVSTPVRIVFSELFMVDGFIQGSSVNFTKFSKDMIPTMCAINITVEAKYIGFAKKDTYLTKSLQSAQENTGAVTTPETTVEGPESGVLRAAIKELGDYQIAVGGTSTQDRPNSEGVDSWGKTTRHNMFKAGYKDIWNQMDYEELYLRVGFAEKIDFKDKGISKLFYENKYVLSFSHQPNIRLWRSFSAGEKQQADASGKTNTGAVKGPGSTGVVGGVQVNRDVLLLDIVGTEAVCTNWDTWKRFKAYGDGGSGRNSKDSGHIKKPNSVFINGTKDKDLAENLYLMGINNKKDHKNDNPLLLEVDLLIKATITTPGVGYSPQYSAAIPTAATSSSIVFTQKFLHIMKPTDVFFKRFKVVEKKSK